MKTRFALLFIVSALCLFGGGCGSTPKPKPKPKPPKFTPPPPPPLEDLYEEARDAESVGLATKNFHARYGLDEAVRAYQRIIDYYPKSREAQVARDKVKSLGKMNRRIRTWQERIEVAKDRFARIISVPSQIHPFYVELADMGEKAPEGFIKKAVLDLIERVQTQYQNAAMADVTEAVKRAESAMKRGDLRDALTAYQALPEGYAKDLPAVAQEISKHRAKLEKAAEERAQRERDRANKAMRSRQERQAIVILHEAWKEYRGFEVAREILVEERRAQLARLKVLTAEASGRTRKLDKELFEQMAKRENLNPDQPKDRESLEDLIASLRKSIERYRAGLEDMSCSPREFEIRRAQLEKMIRWEEERLRRD
ncbi:MAG: hypothetical protein ACYTHN_13060 [Planctomycetota bacterium]|jgi:hypothetical protein